MSISTMGVEEDKNFRESGLKDWALLKALWPFIRPEITVLGFAIILIPITTATQIGLPYVIKQAIDGPVSHDDIHGLWFYCGLFFGLLLLISPLTKARPPTASTMTWVTLVRNSTTADKAESK